MAKSNLSSFDLFESKHIPEPNSGCWLWLGFVSQDPGYPQFYFQGRYQLGHRVSWQLHRGPIPPKSLICHKCDVRSCVNPDHLYVGTYSNNTQDMIRRGRVKYRTGERHQNSKLDADKVRAIRQSTDSLRVLARRFGVNSSVISQVRTRKAWSHIP